MQQHEAKQRATAEAAMKVVTRKNIVRMLEITMQLAIKKTVRFLNHQYFNVERELFRQSGVDLEVVHAQCVVSIWKVRRSSKHV
jgi:macrodomain Ter protein organizer (MatP/YcbG family)